MRSSMVLLGSCLVVAAACGKKADQPADKAKAADARRGAPVARADAAVATPDAAPGLRGPSSYTIVEGSVKVAVTLTTPSTMIDQSTADRLVFNTMNGTWLKVDLTCHGACGDTKQAIANIKTVAVEQFEFTRSDSHVPQLEPVWDQEPVELTPDHWIYGFHGAAPGKNWEEHYLVNEHLIETAGGTLIVDCRVELVKEDLALRDQLLEQCVQLNIVPIPDDRLAWTMEAGPDLIALADIDKVELRISVTNVSKTPVTSHGGWREYTIDGKASMSLGNAFGNGGRGPEWRELAPDATARDTRSGRALGITAPGTYVIATLHHGHELARTTLEVTP